MNSKAAVPLSLTPRFSGVTCGSRRFFNRFNGFLLIEIFFVLLCATAFAEQRFPPPEFESGHQLPVTAVPNARAIIYQYADVAVLAGCLGIASFLVFKKR